MSLYLGTKVSEIKAAPIESVFLYSGADENQIGIKPPNIQKESNITLDAITAKTDKGAEVAVGYKFSASIYFISNSIDIRNRLNALAGLNAVSGQIYFGGDGFNSVVEDQKMLYTFSTADDSIAIKIKEESTQGFFRYNIALSGIMRELPILYR